MKEHTRFRVALVTALVLAAAALALLAVLLSPAQRSKRKLYLGQKYLEQLNYEDAILAFRDAVRIDPNNADACAALGNAWYLRAQSEDDPYLAEAWRNQALEAYENALKLDPDRSDAKEMRDRIRREEKDAEDGASPEKVTPAPSAPAAVTPTPAPTAPPTVTTAPTVTPTQAPTPVPEPETLPESELRARFRDAASGTEIYFLYGDYDCDGTFEAYGLTGDPWDFGYENVNVYFVYPDGEVTLIRSGLHGDARFYTILSGEHPLYRVGEDGPRFFSFEQTAGGSGSTSFIFGVRDGDPYEPDISGKVMDFHEMETGAFVTSGSDFSNGHTYYDIFWYYARSDGQFYRQ